MSSHHKCSLIQFKSLRAATFSLEIGLYNQTNLGQNPMKLYNPLWSSPPPPLNVSSAWQISTCLSSTLFPTWRRAIKFCFWCALAILWQKQVFRSDHLTRQEFFPLTNLFYCLNPLNSSFGPFPGVSFTISCSLSFICQILVITLPFWYLVNRTPPYSIFHIPSPLIFFKNFILLVNMEL